MTQDEDAAKDITQETFITLYQKSGTFKGKSHISTWLYSVAKNKCLRHIENKKRSSVKELERLIETASSPIEEAINETEKNHYISQVKEGCLVGLLQTLVFNQRLAFILVILYDIPIKEVAKIIEKSETATRTLVHRAKINIKDFLCNNCSLYQPENKCKCENLINFSLKQGWINEENIHPSSFAKEIENDLSEIKKITALYHSLPNHSPEQDLKSQINKLLVNNDSPIFTPHRIK